MMWSFVTDAPSAVQMFMLVTCLLMGLSHVLQPGMWVEFFGHLIARRRVGLVVNQFINVGPGALIVTLHQVWTGPAVLVTIYGWALLVKAAIGLLLPELGMRSLRVSERGDGTFRVAGLVMLLIPLACALQLAGIGLWT